MRSIHTLIIGGGQAGLAMSRCLSDRAIDHVVLERGRVAERWRSERWDSLTLLTPNWQTRLPGFRYCGPNPDGYMSMREVIGFLGRYAASFRAPVETATAVTGVESGGDRFRVRSSRGDWLARNVVIATGYSDVPYLPPAAARLSPRMVQVVPTAYRRPDQLPPGGVLVVGASATGIQLAEEMHASGRQVTLAVGGHLRMPRTYRGRDILWWLDAMGILRDTVDSVFDIWASRAQPSLQLVGGLDLQRLDLAALRDRGVRLLGRLVDIEGETAVFDDSILATTVASDIKLAQLVARIDDFITRTGLPAADKGPFDPTWPAAFGILSERLHLRAEGIASVVWATGFRRRYPWLKLPVLDEQGEIKYRGGVTPLPGLYVLGMHFQRRRNSAFIDGVGEDARLLADDIVQRARPKPAIMVYMRREPSWSAQLPL